MTPERTPPPDERRVFLGTLVKVRGLRGEVKITPATWRPERFAELEGIWWRGREGGERFLTFKRVKVTPGAVFIRFHEAPKRELAEELIGGELFIDQEDRLPLPEGAYYLDDLLGCEVTCERYGALGSIVEIITQTAQDIWRVEGPRGEVLIPAVREMVREMDLPGRRVRVSLPEGLVPEEAQPESAGEGDPPPGRSPAATAQDGRRSH